MRASFTCRKKSWHEKGKTLLFAFLLFCCLSSAVVVQSQEVNENDKYFPDELWRVSTPEAQGMDSRILLKMFRTYGNLGRIVIIRNGYLVTDYNQTYLQNDIHHIHSCTKSIISALVGIAIDEGYIKGINQNVWTFLSERQREIHDEHWRGLTLGHLLTMTSGMEWTDSGRPTDSDKMIRTRDWVGYILNRRFAADPGQVWNYNSGNSQLISVMLQKATGRTAQDYADEKIFNPLGIHEVCWWTDPQGHSTAGWGLHLSTFDMAKLGYLFLRNGQWKESRIIPVNWVKASTQSHVSVKSGFGKGFGYGYQWWVYSGLSFYAYKAWGSLGKHSVMVIMIPETDMVIVMTGENSSDKTMLTSFILPSVRSTEPLMPNPEAMSDLKNVIVQSSN